METTGIKGLRAVLAGAWGPAQSGAERLTKQAGFMVTRNGLHCELAE